MNDGKWPQVMRNSFTEEELEDLEPIIEFVSSPTQCLFFFTDGKGVSKERLHCKPPEKRRVFSEENFREEFQSFLAEEINGEYESLAAKLRARTVLYDEKHRKHFRSGGPYRSKLYLYLKQADRGRVGLLYDIL